MDVDERKSALVVFSSLFPSPANPGAGLFIRERMFRVGRRLPVTVISPQPWFPLQGLIRHFRSNYRPMPPRELVQEGITVFYPRFLSFPGVFRWLDGLSMAVASYALMRQLLREGQAHIIDAHFAYPDGYAATLLGKWLGLPTTITLRGTEPRTAGYWIRGRLQRKAMMRADRVFSVADSLRSLALSVGVSENRTLTVGNGVDVEKFHPIARDEARKTLNLSVELPVLVSVGGLVRRKGFHRVIELMPDLLVNGVTPHLLVVGGPGPEGDWSERLHGLVRKLGLESNVHFLGFQSPEKLKMILSAADVFVLATSNEGWANVFLEAMACGLPVITTDVGGNREVVNDARLGSVVPFGDMEALRAAVQQALECQWDRDFILGYAKANTWDQRVTTLVSHYRTICRQTRDAIQ